MAGSTTFKVLFEGDSGKLEKESRRAGDALGDVAKIAGGFLVADALTSLPGKLTAMVGAASDVAESMSKVDVVFGEMSPPVKEFSEAADAIGLSDAAALAATGTFGNLFVALGLPQKAAADLSMDVVGLAADLASFNNIEIDSALEKLRAGLVGEAEPLRALGVNINAATVEAKALEMGLEQVDGKFTESAKVQARYALIMEQTATAQGDFARTSEGLANKQRILAANVEDLQASIGARLVPAFDAGTTAALKLVDASSHIEFSTLALVGVGAAALVAVPKITQAASAIGRLVGEYRAGDRPLNTFSTRLGAITAGLLAADLASQAFTGRSLTERVFGDVASSEASEAAARALDARILAMGESADRTAAGIDLLAAANEALSTGAIETEESVGGLNNVLLGSDGRFFGFNVGASGAVDNLKDLRAQATLAGQEMRAGGASVEELALAYAGLNPALREAFDAGANVTAALAEMGFGYTSLIEGPLVYVRQAFADAAAAAAESADPIAISRDALAGWSDTVAEAKDGTKEFDKALGDLLGTLTTQDPQYIALSANIALVEDKIRDFAAAHTDELNPAQEAELKILTDQLDLLNRTKEGFDSNANALGALTEGVAAYTSDQVAGALLDAMRDGGSTTQEMVDKFGGLQSVYDHLTANDVPGAIRAFEDLRGEMTDEEWSIAASTVGVDIVEGVKAGVTDPIQRDGLLRSLEDTVGLAITGTDPFPLGAYDLGLGITTGAAKGVEAGTPALQSAVEQSALKALAAAKAILGIKSPSTVSAAEVGIPYAEGVALGIYRGFQDYVIPTIEEQVANANALAAITVAPLVAPGVDPYDDPAYRARFSQGGDIPAYLQDPGGFGSQVIYNQALSTLFEMSPESVDADGDGLLLPGTPGYKTNLEAFIARNPQLGFTGDLDTDVGIALAALGNDGNGVGPNDYYRRPAGSGGGGSGTSRPAGDVYVVVQGGILSTEQRIREIVERVLRDLP